MSDLALRDEVLQRAQRARSASADRNYAADRDRCSRSSAASRVLDRLHDVEARGTLLSCVVHLHRELGCQHDVLAAVAGRTAIRRLRAAAIAVDVGGAANRVMPTSPCGSPCGCPRHRDAGRRNCCSRGRRQTRAGRSRRVRFMMKPSSGCEIDVGRAIAVRRTASLRSPMVPRLIVEFNRRQPYRLLIGDRHTRVSGRSRRRAPSRGGIVRGRWRVCPSCGRARSLNAQLRGRCPCGPHSCRTRPALPTDDDHIDCACSAHAEKMRDEIGVAIPCDPTAKRMSSGGPF